MMNRNSLMTVSRMGFGFFLGNGLSRLFCSTSTIQGILTSTILGGGSALGTAYLSFCSENELNPRSLNSFSDFLVDQRLDFSYFIVGLNILAQLLHGNDISYSNALLIASAAEGIATRILANQLPSREDVHQHQPR